MQWFKNIIIYQLNKAFPFTATQLEQKLTSLRFTPCGQVEQHKLGWVSPFGEDKELLTLVVKDHILLCLRKEDKILPQSAIKEHLQQKIIKLEQSQHKKLSKIEKQALKDEAIIDLLPRAFSRFSHTWLWINIAKNLIIVNSTSHNRAEEAISLLRKSVETLPAVLLRSEKPIAILLTQWLLTGEIPAHFMPLQEIELKDPYKGGGVVICKNQDIQGDEVLTHINSGKQVTKLQLNWNDRINFVLTEELAIKKIQYTNFDKNEESVINTIDREQQIDADFLLMSNELNQLIESLVNVLN